MGVSGCGKSTIGALLAKQLDWPFMEGDDLHPPENIAKMSRGIPLHDSDRYPWLQSIAQVLDRWHTEKRSGILTCSALRRSYREILIEHRPFIRFIYLKGSRSAIQQQLVERHDHFMSPRLLDSQFMTFEEPEPDEPVITCSIDASPKDIVKKIINQL